MCIQSYSGPGRHSHSFRGEHQWNLLDAALATCSRHPYSPATRIFHDFGQSYFRDPALCGHSNPIRSAVAEAQTLFEGQEVIFISLGCGRVESASVKPIVHDTKVISSCF